MSCTLSKSAHTYYECVRGKDVKRMGGMIPIPTENLLAFRPLNTQVISEQFIGVH